MLVLELWSYQRSIPFIQFFWLVVVFTGSAVFFLWLGIAFVALMFLIIYVGAIAILFLFVIMLLNLTDFPPAFRLGGEADMTNYVPIGLLIGTFFFFRSRFKLINNRWLLYPSSFFLGLK